jgi:membrane protein DedA with SNARE-associated domain
MLPQTCWAIFLSVFSTLIFPVPEEIFLLAAGYSARAGIVHLVPAFLSAWAAIMAGDWITYTMGRTLLPWLLTSKLGRRIVKPEWQEWANGFVNRHGVRAIAIGRFFINGLVGLLEVAIVVGTGYLIGPHEGTEHSLRVFDYAIAAFILLVTVVIPIIFKKYFLTKVDAKTHASEASTDAPTIIT